MIRLNRIHLHLAVLLHIRGRQGAGHSKLALSWHVFGMIIITIGDAHREDIILINLCHVYDLMTTSTLTNDLTHSFIRCCDFRHLLLNLIVFIIFRVFGGLLQDSRFL